MICHNLYMTRSLILSRVKEKRTSNRNVHRIGSMTIEKLHSQMYRL